MPLNDSQDRQGVITTPENSRQTQPLTTTSTPHHEIPISQNPPPHRSNIERANFFSLLHFLFGLKLIRKVHSIKGRPLKIQDLEPIGETECCENLEKSFTKYYKGYSKKYPKKRRVMTWVLFKIFKKNILIQAFWQLLYALCRLMVAYFVYLIIYALRNYSNPTKDCYLAMIGYGLCSILAFYSINQYNFNSAYTVNRMRIGMLGMLFRKINKLGLHSVNVMNLGKLINVSANDLNNLDRITFVVSLLISPLVIGAALGLLWYFWGPSCLVGIGYMMFVWIIQWSFAYPTTSRRRAKSGFTDERIKMLEESIGAIRLVKMYGWEWNCINLVEKVRAKEINRIKTFNFMDSVSRAFTFSSHWMAAFLIYVTYTETEAHIIPAKIFSTILILTLLRQTIEIQIFNCFLFFIEIKLLFMRTMSIMDLPETPSVENVKPVPLNPENSIEFENFSAFWQHKDENNTPEESYPAVLSNINLEIKKGSVNIIIGKVASGKSSLLLALTNEIPGTAGIIRYQGTYSYVAQNPILFYGPLKDSVIWGKAYDEDLFWRVLEVCCLSDDVKKLPEKEMSEIGERGIILSASQRTRLILARALYSEADIYLLDDPLIGLDAKLAKRVFRNAILGFLKDRTVLIITHRFYFLKYVDKVILVDSGKLVAEGTYRELKEKGILAENQFEFNETKVKDAVEVQARRASRRRTISSMRRMSSLYQREEDEDHENLPGLRNELAGPGLDEGLFIEDERLDDGKVTWKIYGNYFKMMLTWFNFIPLGVLFVGAEAVSWLFFIMVGKWGRGEYSDTTGIIVVGCLCVGGLLLHLFKFLLYYNSTLNASHKFHNLMLRGVFFSSFKFFDKNSVGRIISRFCNDIGILDKFLISALLDVLEGFCLFFVYLVTLWVEEPYILIPAAIGAIVYFVVYFWCRKALKETRGLELTTRAPLYSLFLIEVEGLATMRARRQTEDVIKTFYRKADDHSRANISYLVSVRFMSFVINYIVELIVIATFCVFIPVKNTPLSRGYFINILTLLPTTMQWIFQNFIILSLIMSSVARVINFCENRGQKGLLKAKPQEDSDNCDWPKSGDIEVQNVNMRYTNKSERFLKDLSFHINSGERVAVICGSRAGISHIVALLLKLFDIDECEQEGHEPFIKIDHVDLKDITCDNLRKAVLIIPQNSYIVSGTIRTNLDPWDQHSDEEIWKALEQVKLKEYIEGLKEKLQTNLGKGLSVFSVGQKHLLAIARAILRGGKIIIQDEATTHVDLTTNNIVQKNLIRMYKDCTLITITQRLRDIVKYDKVLLIQNGEKVEFDEPYRLLVKEIGDTAITNERGAFAGLVRSLGSELSANFIKTCMKKYYKKHGLKMEDVSWRVRFGRVG